MQANLRSPLETHMRRNQQGLLMEDAWERVRQKSGTSACLMERKAKATRKQSIWQRGGPPKGRESSDYNGLRKRGSPDWAAQLIRALSQYAKVVGSIYGQGSYKTTQ